MVNAVEGALIAPFTISANVLLASVFDSASKLFRIFEKILHGGSAAGGAADSIAHTDATNTLDKLNTGAQLIQSFAQIAAVIKPNLYTNAAAIQTAAGALATGIARTAQAIRDRNFPEAAVNFLGVLGSVATQVAAVASVIPHPGAQALAKVASLVGLLATGGQLATKNWDWLKKQAGSLASLLAGKLSAAVPPFLSMFAGLASARDPLVFNLGGQGCRS